MNNKNIEELKNYHNAVMSIEEFEKLEKNENIKMIKFVGSEIGIKEYQISKYAVLLKDEEVITIYQDIPTW